MSAKDRKELRRYMSQNPGRTAQERAYFAALDRDLAASGVWSTTTTTTTTTSSTSSTSTTSTSTTTTTV